MDVSLAARVMGGDKQKARLLRLACCIQAIPRRASPRHTMPGRAAPGPAMLEEV